MLAEAFVRLPVIGKVDGRSVALGNQPF